MRSLALSFLFLFVFTIPLEEIITIPGVGSIARLAGIIAMCVALSGAFLSGSVRRPGYPLVFALVFVMWVVISSVWSIDLDVTIARIRSVLQLFAFMLLMWEFGRGSAEILSLLRAYILGSAIASVGTIFSFVLGATRYGHRFVLPGFDPNDLGLILALSLPMIWHMIGITRRRFEKTMYGIVLMTNLAAILLTGSRGAVIATIAGVGTSLILDSRIRLTTKLSSIPMVSVFVLGVSYVLPQELVIRYATIPNELREGTLAARRLIWQAGIKAFWERPLFGTGAGTFTAAIQPFWPVEKVAHNVILSISVELGFVGLLLFLSVIVAAVFGSLRRKSYWLPLMFSLLATWFVGVMALSWEYKKATWFLLGLLAVFTVARRDSDTNSRNIAVRHAN